MRRNVSICKSLKKRLANGDIQRGAILATKASVFDPVLEKISRQAISMSNSSTASAMQTITYLEELVSHRNPTCRPCVYDRPIYRGKKKKTRKVVGYRVRYMATFSKSEDVPQPFQHFICPMETIAPDGESIWPSADRSDGPHQADVICATPAWERNGPQWIIAIPFIVYNLKYWDSPSNIRTISSLDMRKLQSLEDRQSAAFSRNMRKDPKFLPNTLKQLQRELEKPKRQ